MDGIWDTVSDTWDSLFNGDEIPVDIPQGQPPNTQEEAGFWDSVNRFKRKADEFWSAYKRLESLEPIAMQSADTAASYNRVMGSGQSITENIEDTADRIREAVSWGAMSGIQVNPGQLGALGLLPVAIIAAAIAAMGIWLSDAYVEIRKLESIKTMIGEGTDPKTAGDIVRGDGGGFGGAFGSELGKAAGFAAIVGIGIWYLMRKG